VADTIPRRFAASLVGNLLRSGVSLVSALLLARWLGPSDYGRMAFLFASLLAVRALLDMGTSAAFFTFLSQRPRGKRFVSLFWRWVGLQFLFSFVVIGLLLPDDWVGSIWKGEGRALVLLAFVAAFMQGTVWPIASQMAEAQRETVRAQRLSICVTVLHLGVVLVLWWAAELTLPVLFGAVAVEWGLAGWFAARLYQSRVESAGDIALRPADTVRSVWREFWQYCLPFVPYAWLGFAHDFADRWMLQHWGGAAEQAYYAVAYQFAAVALLATTSILQIFWKEIAEAHHRQDELRVQTLYFKATRGLYFVGAVTAGALLPWAGEILEILLGKAYIGGALTLSLMFLYPVHQSMGQIGGSILLATGRTKIQVTLGLSFMSSSLVVAYFMMAPRDAVIPGFGLASEGLAYKMLLMQVLQVNILAWFIARTFEWKFDWNFQIVGLALTVLAGWLSKEAATVFVALPLLAAMVVAAAFYAAMVAGMLYLAPWIAGTKRAELQGFARHLFVRPAERAR
jgi:O-antigen/teichoic acid export membrane protein